MAIIPLSSWKLSDSREKVRMMLQVEGEQEELLFNTKVDDLIYDSTVQTRMLLRKLVDHLYSTTIQSAQGEFAEESGVIDLAGINAVDLVSALLYDLEMHKTIPLKLDADYYSIMALYATNPSAYLGHITNILLNGSNVNAIEVFRGTTRAMQSGNITYVTTASPSEITTESAHGLSTGDLVAIRGTVGTDIVLGIHAITKLTATTFTVPVNETGTYIATSGTYVRIPLQRLTYNRIPVRPATDTACIDLPHAYIPNMEDMACVAIARYIRKSPPVEVEQRAMSFVKAQMEQVGLTISPIRK
jgi:hypothetical protein